MGITCTEYRHLFLKNSSQNGTDTSRISCPSSDYYHCCTFDYTSHHGLVYMYMYHGVVGAELFPEGKILIL